MEYGEQSGSVDEVLNLADQAIAAGDWNRVLQLTAELLAGEPRQTDALALRRMAERQLAGRTPSDDTERRFLTVVFVDLVGSTAISERLDPEEFAALLDRYQHIISAAITEYGGSIVKLLGDGVMAQFGYPHALEEAPRLACRAGFKVIEDLAGQHDELLEAFGVSVECRVGVHTGTAVITSGDVLGEVPNMAATLEGMASPGGMAVSEATGALLEGAFELEPIGHPSVTAYRVIQPIDTSVRGRDLDGGTIVGRATELLALQRAWDVAQAGTARVVAIVGEAGIGKSRLIAELARSVSHATVWIEGGAAAFRKARPFHVFADALNSHLGSSQVDPTDAGAVAEKLRIDVDQAKVLITSGRPPPDESRNPAQLRRIVFEATAEWLTALARETPVVLVLEDLHWADPSTLELIAELARTLGDLPVLSVLTSRTASVVPAGAEVISLSPLTAEEVRDLVDQLDRDLHFDDHTRAALATRAGGVPLFVHELARTVRASPDAIASVPQSLRDLLGARLDSFGHDKRAAQVASVLGRSFRADVVAAMDDGGEIGGALERLAVGGLLERLPDGATPYYRFAHSLLQDAAYESVLRSERRLLHALAVDAISRLDPDLAAEAPDLIGHHLTEAGMSRQAFEKWLEAGEVAAARSASMEAVSHFDKAADVLAELPAGPEQDELEYRLMVGRSSPLTAVHGYAADVVELTYERTAELAAADGDPLRRFAAIRGLASTRLLRAEISKAGELAAQALAIAQESADIDLRLEARTWLGTVDFFAGRLESAREHLEVVTTLYDTASHAEHGLRFGIDPLVLSDSHRAWLLQLIGDASEALALAQRTVDHARAIDHRLSVAHALNYLAGLHQMRTEPDEQLAAASAEVELATEYGYVHYIHYGRILAGHAAAILGKPESVDDMRRALNDRRAGGAALARPYHLYLIADADRRYGLDSTATLSEAAHVGSRTGELWWSAQIEAALHIQRPDPGG